MKFKKMYNAVKAIRLEVGADLKPTFMGKSVVSVYLYFSTILYNKYNAGFFSEMC